MRLKRQLAVVTERLTRAESSEALVTRERKALVGAPLSDTSLALPTGEASEKLPASRQCRCGVRQSSEATRGSCLQGAGDIPTSAREGVGARLGGWARVQGVGLSLSPSLPPPLSLSLPLPLPLPLACGRMRGRMCGRMCVRVCHIFACLHAARCTLHAARCTLHAARCTLHAGSPIMGGTPAHHCRLKLAFG